ncbi:MAG TPA: hypothetical protein VKR32_11355 [Puia sp.]|nr:hypothetical protein [Puia sp.]
MKILLTSILLTIIILCGCHDRQPQAGNAATDAPTEKKHFFPVVDYMRGQIRIVDSLPTAILKVVTRDGKPDSSFIKRDEFDRLASEFIPADLQQENFETHFKETSFLDQTTNSATFTYSSTDPKLALQRVDVLATPDEVYSKVKSIYLQETLNKNDTVIVKKLIWQAKKRFQIATSEQAPNDRKKMTQVQVTWFESE